MRDEKGLGSAIGDLNGGGIVIWREASVGGGVGREGMCGIWFFGGRRGFGRVILEGDKCCWVLFSKRAFFLFNLKGMRSAQVVVKSQ